MTFDEYQTKALTTAINHPDERMNQTIFAMGISGEAGEVLEKWKKIVAYYDGEVTPERIAEIKKELGDVVWYIAVFAESLGLSLDEVMQFNLEKLASRKKRNTQRGEGDNR